MLGPVRPSLPPRTGPCWASLPRSRRRDAHACPLTLCGDDSSSAPWKPVDFPRVWALAWRCRLAVGVLMTWLPWLGAVWLSFLVGFVLGAAWSGLLKRERRFEFPLSDQG